MRLFYSIVILVLGLVVLYLSVSRIESFFSDAIRPSTLSQNLLNDVIYMKAVENAVNGTDKTLPAKSIPVCHTLDPAQTYQHNQTIMRKCAASIAPLLRGMRYNDSKLKQKTF
jgi:hypothetical protein